MPVSESIIEDTICYLTINESIVQKGKTQRRPNMHTDHPGHDPIINLGGGECTGKWVYIGFGGGYFQQKPIDGIFMASSVDSTCAIWDCSIDEVDNKEIIGHLGDCQHL